MLKINAHIVYRNHLSRFFDAAYTEVQIHWDTDIRLHRQTDRHIQTQRKKWLRYVNTAKRYAETQVIMDGGQ